MYHAQKSKFTMVISQAYGKLKQFVTLIMMCFTCNLKIQWHITVVINLWNDRYIKLCSSGSIIHLHFKFKLVAAFVSHVLN